MDMANGVNAIFVHML